MKRKYRRNAVAVVNFNLIGFAVAFLSVLANNKFFIVLNLSPVLPVLSVLLWYLATIDSNVNLNFKY